MEQSTLLAAAQTARKRLDWRTAAIGFTQVADALPVDPHGNITATESSLRRDAHHCLNRTVEFQAYRERARSKRPAPDLCHEWLQPSGELVHRLLTPRARAAA